MATPWIPTLASVLLVSALSLIGAATLLIPRLRTHAVLVGLVGLAVGALLGDAFFHILPEAVDSAGGFEPSLGATVLIGFLVFFLLEIAFRWGHAHGEVAHDPAHEHTQRVAAFGWLNLIGDGVHNFVDGVLIGAAFLIDVPLGIATTIAVAAHELPQELGDFGVLLKAGIAPGRALLLNLGTALLAVLGAVLVLAIPLPEQSLELIGLPLIAGGFLYIAAADLVPELHHHTAGRYLVVVLCSLILGATGMAALLLFEA